MLAECSFDARRVSIIRTCHVSNYVVNYPLVVGACVEVPRLACHLLEVHPLVVSARIEVHPLVCSFA